MRHLMMMNDDGELENGSCMMDDCAGFPILFPHDLSSV